MKILPLILITASAFAQTAIFPGGVVTDNQLGVAANITRAQLANQVGLTDTTFNVTNSSCVKSGYAMPCNVAFVPNMMLVLDNEAVQVCAVVPGSVTTALRLGHSSCPNIDGRGFDSTVIATHNAAIISSISIAWNHNALAKEVEAIESNLSSGAVVSTYNFTPQSPGISIVAGSNTITMSPVPRGVNGTDTAHYLYLSGGTGTAEICLITGGSAVSGQSSGQIVMTCANTHSGAWTVASASFGLQEAVNVVGASGGGNIQIPAGVFTLRSPVYIGFNNISIKGAGGGTCCQLGTWVTRTGDFGDSISVGSNTVQVNTLKFSDFSLVQNLGYSSGTIANRPTSGAHIHLWGSNTVTIERMRFEDMPNNVIITGAVFVTIRDCQFAGFWNSAVSGLQVTMASALINQVASGIGHQIPTYIALLNNVFLGDRPGNQGPRQHVQFDSCEDCLIDQGSMGGASLDSVLFNANGSYGLLMIRVTNIKFDGSYSASGAETSDIRFITDGAQSTNHVIISHNIFDGENLGVHAVFVPYLALTALPVQGLEIVNNEMLAYLGTPVLLEDGTGLTVNGNMIHYYNTANTYSDVRGSSAVYFSNRSQKGMATGNFIGGGQDFGNYGSPNFANYGISLDQPTSGFQATIQAFDNVISFGGLNPANFAVNVPTLSGSCGASPSIDQRSTDTAGSFTTGTGSPASCIVTFRHPLTFSDSTGAARAPFCTVGNIAGAATPPSSAVNTALTVTTTTASATYNWTCK